MLKLSNSNVRRAVQERVEFKNTNGTLFGKWETPFLYVVYSYGEHFPLYLYDARPGVQAWAVNTDRYSVTTSRHKNAANPQCALVGSDTLTLIAYILNEGRETDDV